MLKKKVMMMERVRIRNLRSLAKVGRKGNLVVANLEEENNSKSGRSKARSSLLKSLSRVDFHRLYCFSTIFR